MSYDTWLEAPYVARANEEAAYERWVEAEGLDFDEDHWGDFEAAMEDEAQDAADDAAEARAEQRREDADDDRYYQD